MSKSVADINVTINSIGSGANFSAITSQVEGLKSSFSSLKGIVSGVFGVGLGVGGISELQKLADAYQGVTNRIITTTSSVQQLTAIQDELFQVAQQTGVALDTTAKTYQRLEQVIQGSGKSQIEAQQEAIQLT